INKEDAKKSDLFDIVKSHQVLDNLLSALERDNYLEIKENERGPKRYSISLTPKGIAVANQLQRANDIASGKSIPTETICIDLPEGIHEQILKILKIDKLSSNEQDFIMDAVKREIERWKKEHPGHP
ncbi:MAG: hypothetical protein ACP5OE_09515, partial [Thermodesulfobium sp.]